MPAYPRPLLMALCLAVWLVPHTASAEEPQPAKVISDQNGLVQVTLPPQWVMEDMPSMGIKVGVGPAFEDFPTTVNLLSEPYDGTLEAYVQETLKQIKQQFPKLKILKQEAVTSSSGVKMIQLVTDNEIHGAQVHQIFFLGSAGEGNVFLLTCAAAQSVGSKLTPVFEGIGKSVQLRQ